MSAVLSFVVKLEYFVQNLGRCVANIIADVVDQLLFSVTVLALAHVPLLFNLVFNTDLLDFDFPEVADGSFDKLVLCHFQEHLEFIHGLYFTD